MFPKVYHVRDSRARQTTRMALASSVASDLGPGFMCPFFVLCYSETFTFSRKPCPSGSAALISYTDVTENPPLVLYYGG